jgi:hypothetical protein
MRSSLLDVAEGHACVGGGGDERVAQGMRPDGLVDPGTSRYAAHETSQLRGGQSASRRGRQRSASLWSQFTGLPSMFVWRDNASTHVAA